MAVAGTSQCRLLAPYHSMHDVSGMHHHAPLIAILSFAVTTSSEAQQLDRKRLTKLVDSIVTTMQARQHVPGATVLIAQGARPVLAKGYGVIDLDLDAPATVQSVYAIASITKEFTAAAILQLARENKLQLDDDVSKYLPDLPMVHGPLTLRQLLHHTSGIAATGPLGDQYWMRRDYTREEWLAALDRIYRTREREFPSGTRWAYRDINYMILGLVIEKITGRTLWDVFNERFFAPLKMTSTTRCDPGVVMKHRANGYVSNTNAPFGVVPVPYVTSTVSLGNSGLCSTVSDLLTWQRALVEHRVLDSASYTLMKTPGSLSDGTSIDYALGLIVWPLGNETMVWHSGGGVGFTSFFGYLPGNDVTFVILTNGNSDPWRIGAEVARVARGLPLVTGLPLTPDEIAQYVGTYEASGVKATVRERDGELEAQITGTNSARFFFSPRLLKRKDGSFAVLWEPESSLRFHLSAARADSVSLSYAGRMVTLARTN
jgi:CubicO group peptidase (beta-lactamase class C family)